MMANTYTQLYVHLVFAPQGRESLIVPSIEDRIYRYIDGILKGMGHTLIAIDGMPDHIHVLIGYKPIHAISDIMRELKSQSSKFINEHRLIRGHFSWQKGYGAFSVSHRQLDAVAGYIRNQKAHHLTTSFRNEYQALLQHAQIDFHDQFIFSDPAVAYGFTVNHEFKGQTI